MVAAAFATTAVYILILIALSASGNSLMQTFDGMISMMERGRMQMQAPEDADIVQASVAGAGRFRYGS